MKASDETLFCLEELTLLKALIHRGAEDASMAFSKWTGKPASITVDSVEQLPLQEATEVLGTAGNPICFCAMEMTGGLTGQLILGFEDASGWALAELLLVQPVGTCLDWGEMETSAALETTNILGCAFLNSLATGFPAGSEQALELIPSPPTFSRDFPESLIEFALMGQAMIHDCVLVARTQFQINETPVDWHLLVIPDAESLLHLRSMLRPANSSREV